MADEPIVFQVSDEGSTDRLTSLLLELGVIGEETFAKIQAGVANLSRSEQDVAANQTLMNAAMAAGLSDATRLGEILDSLSGIELKMAAETPAVVAAIQDLGVAEQVVAQRAREAAAAEAEQAAAFQALVAAAAEAATALRSEMSAASEGTSVAMAYRQANFAAAESDTARATASVSATAALRDAKGAVTSLATSLTAYIGVTALLHDTDAYESSKQALQAVAGAGTDVKAVFDQVAASAVSTQQPIETVAKATAQFYAAIKAGGGTLEQAASLADSLGKAFYATQTPVSAAQRVMHDFTEALSQGNLQGQQLRSFAMQAPAVFSLFTDALGVNARALGAHSQHIEELKTKLGELKASQGEATQSVSSAQSAYNSASTQVKNLTDKLADQQATLQATTQARGANSAAALKQQDAVQKTAAALQQEQQKLAASRSALNTAKTAQEANTQAKIKATEAAISNATALDRETLIATLSSGKFRDTVNALAASANGTVKGAFVALNDQIVKFLGTTGSADATVRVFNLALGLIGQSVGVLIPLGAAFFAVWAAAKFASIAAGVYQFVTATETLNVALAVMDALLAPEVLAIAAIGIAVAGVVTYFGQWGTVLSVLGAIWNATVATFQAAVNAVGVAWQFVQTAMEPIIERFLPVWQQSSQAIQDLWQAISTTFTGFGNILDSISQKLGLQGTAWQNVSNIVAAFWNNVSKPLLTLLVDGIGGTAVAAISGLIAVFDLLVKGATAFLNILNSIMSAIGFIKDNPVSGGAGDGPAAKSRDGSSFTVGGSSGVDTKLIAVSPGEHVSITTPAQHYGHSAYPTNGPQPVAKFRDGGTFDLSGLKSVFQAANDNAVSGFSGLTGDSYYTTSQGTDYSAASVRAVAQARAERAAAQAAAAASKAAAAQAAAQSAASSASSVSTGSTAGGLDLSTSVGSGGAIGLTATSGLTSVDATATSAQRQKKQDAIVADGKALAAAKQVTAIDGISKPDDKLAAVGGPISAAQAGVWVSNGSSWSPNAGVLSGAHKLTYAGDWKAAAQKLSDDQAKPDAQFRDGGDFTVPGMGGVDSQIIKMAVSPGEQVSVKTPAQQYADAQNNNDGGSRTYNFNVTTPDANSFAKSKRQVYSDMKRQIASARG